MPQCGGQYARRPVHCGGLVFEGFASRACQVFTHETTKRWASLDDEVGWTVSVQVLGFRPWGWARGATGAGKSGDGKVTVKARSIHGNSAANLDGLLAIVADSKSRRGKTSPLQPWATASRYAQYHPV